MEKDATLALHRAWQMAIKDALMPLLSDESTKHRLTALPTFYVMRDAKGVLSVGQLGMSPEMSMRDAALVGDKVIAVMLDLEDNRETGMDTGTPMH